MKLEQMYQQIILDHYRNPHRSGLREPFDSESFQINPTCGDEVKLRVALEGDRVADVSYEAMGCSISQAATSVLTDLVVGRTVGESLSKMDAFVEMVQSRGQIEPDEEVLEDAVAFAGVSRYPARVKCALLGWMAFKDALGQVDSSDSGAADSGTDRSDTDSSDTGGSGTDGSGAGDSADGEQRVEAR